MEPLAKTCGHTLNKLLQLLTMPVHRPIAHNEVLASFKDLKQSYSAIVEELLNTASLNWNFVTLLLCNISTLQKVFSTLLTNPSPLSSACLSIFSVKTFLIDLLHFNDCDEKILRHAAQNCFTVLFICLKKSTNSENFEETLNYALNQICHKEKIFLCRCRHLELITVLLKQFRVQRMELCGWFWEQFIPELCHTEFKNAENYKEGESCHALLKFLCEILNTEHPEKKRLDSYPQFCKSLASMNEYIFSLMHFVDLCMMNVSYRLLYFQVIAACLKYLPQDENTWSVKQPRIVLKAVANSKLVGYFQKEPKFVGFGSRQRVDDKEKTDITCGFSPAEKMLLLNNLLSACQLVAKLQNDIEVMSSTETIMFGLLSAFEPKDFVSKVFEIYIEQDDMMIEFLQLYLNNFLMAERCVTAYSLVLYVL